MYTCTWTFVRFSEVSPWVPISGLHIRNRESSHIVDRVLRSLRGELRRTLRHTPNKWDRACRERTSRAGDTPQLWTSFRIRHAFDGRPQLCSISRLNPDLRSEWSRLDCIWGTRTAEELHCGLPAGAGRTRARPLPTPRDHNPVLLLLACASWSTRRSSTIR